ncbi:hypothetical protein SprV_0602168200 [Sparganum proliferum]
MHPRSRRYQLLDYVLVWRRDWQNMMVTEAVSRPVAGRTTASLSPKRGSVCDPARGHELPPRARTSAGKPKWLPTTPRNRRYGLCGSSATEKCQKVRNHLYTTFMGLVNAFDTVGCEGLWEIMQRFGCPERVTSMVRLLHDGIMARVTDNSEVSETVAVASGVHPGCVLAPTFLSLMFTAMLMETYRDERPRIHIAYRTGGHLLKGRRMQAPCDCLRLQPTTYSSPRTARSTPQSSCMGQLSHIRIPDSGIHHSTDIHSTPCTPIMPGPINTPTSSAPITSSFIAATTTGTDSDSPDLS